MNALTIFYLEGCPYCAGARRAYAALTAANADYARVPVEWIEETEQAALAERYDYFRVPSFFLGERKLFEARLFDRYEDIESALRAALDAALDA